MSNINELVAFQKMEDLTVILHKMLSTIPKKEQFALSEDIKKQMYLISKLMIHINTLRKDRREYFSRVSEEFDFLFYLIRLLYRLKYISTKQYMRLSEKVNEVIKICCG
ncbi:MAG: four helix bundle protein [Candidatus Pacebacteria bacterium]|nr:four helix bundle protein [Candidatus Paceibacterota bacterium]